MDLKDPFRDFIGRRALETKPLERRLVGLLLEDKGVLRSHQKVITEHGDGETTSGSFSPTLQGSVALARVPAAVQPGTQVLVQVRDKQLKAKVVKPPFARHGKPLNLEN